MGIASIPHSVFSLLPHILPIYRLVSSLILHRWVSRSSSHRALRFCALTNAYRVHLLPRIAPCSARTSLAYGVSMFSAHCASVHLTCTSRHRSFSHCVFAHLPRASRTKTLCALRIFLLTRIASQKSLHTALLLIRRVSRSLAYRASIFCSPSDTYHVF